MKEKGFILLGMLFIMVLMAVAAVALNRRAGLQNRMAANQARAVQTQFNQEAAMEDAIWRLTKNPCWRTSSSGEDYSFNGITYNRKVLASTVSGHTDAVTVSVSLPGSGLPKKSSFRYFTYFPYTPPIVETAIYHVCIDSSNNLFFAVPDEHKIYRRDAATGDITVVAGNGTSGYSGDNGPAIEAQLSEPRSVSLDSPGNLYIADTLNNCIRKVDALSGNIITVAGIGGPDSKGYSGDGGTATNAKLAWPMGVFIEHPNRIFIADTENHCIRKVEPGNLKITTVAGIGGPASMGYSGDGGAATDAKLNKPKGVAIDSLGNLYIVDTGNHCIRRVDIVTGNISTVAGTGESSGYSGDGGTATSAQLSRPGCVAVDSSENIYIADTQNNRVRKVEVASGIINTIAGTGTAGYSGDGGSGASAQLDHPSGICLTGTGEVIISDTMNTCLRQINLIGNISSLFLPAGIGLNKAKKIALDASGNLYIADMENHVVRKLDISGNVTIVAGKGTAGYSGDGNAATDAELNEPRGISVDAAGSLYIADTGNHCIRKVDAGTGDISPVAGTGSEGFSGDGGAATSAQLNEPQGISVDASGNLYIADTENHRIRKVDAETGNITTVAGRSTFWNWGGYSGDGGAATSATLRKPRGISVDASGNLYIADTGNHCIRKVDAGTGNITTVAGIGGLFSWGYSGDGGAATSAQLNSPENVAVDSSGNLFIADLSNDRIRVVSVHDGIINTLAGNGVTGFNGDAQPAVTAQLNKPTAVAMAVTRGGAKIYISDTENNRIRVLSFKRVKELY